MPAVNPLPPGPGAALPPYPPPGQPMVDYPGQNYNTAGQPPTPMVGPQMQPFGYTPPNPGTFTGQAPTASPYGSFAPPDVKSLDSDPTYQYDLAQQQKAMQRSAAARGTLLTGGLQGALAENASNVAGRHYGDIFNRALSAYGTNRDTHAQNFGQAMGTFQGNLAGFNANAGATLGYGRLGLESATAGYDRNAEAARTAAGVTNANAAGMDAYRQSLPPPVQAPNPQAAGLARLGYGGFGGRR